MGTAGEHKRKTGTVVVVNRAIVDGPGLPGKVWSAGRLISWFHHGTASHVWLKRLSRGGTPTQEEG